MTQNSRLKNTAIKARVVDLFCGAGGTSTGAKRALKKKGYAVELLAINHWDVAVATHTANHPEARHLCKAVDSVNPLDVIPGRHLDLFVASPTCIHHSRARGGKPTEDQKRADGWDVLRWVENLDIDNILLENVAEWQDWGPVDHATGKPIPEQKGLYFRRFIETLQVTHNVEYRVLNCADYGDPTTRKRLFVIARKGETPITWPKQTHYNPKKPKPAGRLRPWKTAAEHVIDWSLKGTSIFTRKTDGKRELSPNTVRRIMSGLFEHGLRDWILNNQGTERRTRGTDEPVAAVLGSNHKYLVEPIEVGGMEELQAYLTQAFGERGGQRPRTRSENSPVWTVTAQNRTGVCQPFIVRFKNNETAESIDKPLKGQTTKNANGLADVKPFVFNMAHSVNPDHRYTQSSHEPLSVITAKASHGFVEGESYMIPQFSTLEHRSLKLPVNAVTASSRGIGIVTPFLVQFNTKDRQLRPVTEPIGAVTTKDRFGLCIPQFGIVVDILFRMLQPHELAAAQGFPKNYKFTGNKSEIVKQIGNAVPGHTAEALVSVLI